ncbi:MAG: hypothetical protein K8E66_08450, partial [Phycisphaerales bacterium]|nr:hypothetical protein [Phycisphaerales bacterium]
GAGGSAARAVAEKHEAATRHAAQAATDGVFGRHLGLNGIMVELSPSRNGTQDNSLYRAGAEYLKDEDTRRTSAVGDQHRWKGAYVPPGKRTPDSTFPRRVDGRRGTVGFVRSPLIDAGADAVSASGPG